MFRPQMRRLVRLQVRGWVRLRARRFRRVRRARRIRRIRRG